MSRGTTQALMITARAKGPRTDLNRPGESGGCNGKVDVVYYASTASSTDDPTAVWNTYDSQRLAGAWTVARVSPTPNRVGAVCLDGAACTANKRHMAPELFAELADATHAHAWAHGVDDASGWRVYHNGIVSWWSAEGGLDAEGERRLHKLRSDVVAWLSERGIPEGHHPRATPLRVRRR
jgi:hypothetical protein